MNLNQLGEKIADNITRERLKNNLSQQKLADKSGISRITIARWETGVHTPTLEGLLLVSNSLGVSLKKLVG